jgi:transcriptional regulator with XRE-family HTH domain
MDTKKITNELLATGLTEQELADLVRCSQPTINAFRHGTRGARPSMQIGTKLLELHKERCAPVSIADEERADEDRPGRKPINRDRIMTASVDLPPPPELLQ